MFFKMRKLAFLLLLAVATTLQTDAQNCWHNVSHNCAILALFTRSETNKFHVTVNCSSVYPIVLDDSPFSQRYSEIPKIFWDGCLATNFLPDMGLSLIVDPAAVLDLEVVEFQIEKLEPKMFENFTSLRSLQLQRNSVERIENGTFVSLIGLSTLVIKDNQLKTIELNALDGGGNLKNLTIEERSLKHLELDFTGNRALEIVQLVGIGSIEQKTIASLFNTGVNLRSVSILNTKLTESFLTVPSMRQLEVMEVSDCQLMSLHIGQPTLLQLNASHNSLRSEIYLQLRNMDGLLLLDLSYNLFKALRNMFCNDCINLEVLNLHHNQITFVATDFLQTNHRLKVLDLSNNRLHVLLLDMAMLRYESLQTVYVDRNPWICSWIVNVSRQHGEVFSKFKFVRVLDKININGLQCQVKIERPPEDPIQITNKSSAVPNIEGPVSPREPTTEEINFLTICLILMLTVIVAVALFICLYDRFKRMRHSPFYRLILPANRASTTSSNAHFSLRKLPATDYEAPISQCDEYVKDEGHRNSNLYEELPSSGQQTRQCSPSKQDDPSVGTQGQDSIQKYGEDCLI